MRKQEELAQGRRKKNQGARILSLLLVMCMVFVITPQAASGNKRKVITDTLNSTSGITQAACRLHKEHSGCSYSEKTEEMLCFHLRDDGSYDCEPKPSATPINMRGNYICDHHKCGGEDDCRYQAEIPVTPCDHSCDVCSLDKKEKNEIILLDRNRDFVGSYPANDSSETPGLSKAFDLAEDGDTIQIAKDFNVTETVKFLNKRNSDNITLDLNGNTISRLIATPEPTSFIYVYTNTLTITDSKGGGEIKSNCSSSVTMGEGSHLILEGGTIENSYEGGSALILEHESLFHMNGGTLSGNPGKGLLATANSTTIIELGTIFSSNVTSDPAIRLEGYLNGKEGSTVNMTIGKGVEIIAESGGSSRNKLAVEVYGSTPNLMIDTGADITGKVSDLMSLTVSLTAAGDQIILAPQNAKEGYKFYYKITEKSDAANKLENFLLYTGGYTEYSTDTYISGIADANMYVQVIMVNLSNTIIGWGEAATANKPETRTLSGITITTPPQKTAYTEGESFDNAGMTVTAAYNDGSTAVVTDYKVSPSGALDFGTTSVTISYTEAGVNKTAVQAIQVSERRKSGSSGGGRAYQESLPAGYKGGIKLINGVKVPDYVTEGNWQASADGRWKLMALNGSDYKGVWVPAYNPYANVGAGQFAFDWFAFDGDGFMITGWYTDEQNNSYYLNTNSDNTKGSMITGWNIIDGKYYYFNEKPDGTRGKLYRNTTTPDGYFVDGNGVLVQ